jgi:hypothetical protein
MPYDINLDVQQIAKTTLYLLENTNYSGSDGGGRNGGAITSLKNCLRKFLADFQPEATGAND